MEGTVSHFLPTKGFGFIQGDDGRSYFAHQSDFGGSLPVDGLRVRFTEDVTPKGYRARRIMTIGTVDTDLFVVPDGILQTREAEIRDWEVIEASPWRIHGSSRESPDHARAELIGKAGLLGATGVVLVQYYKTRGSEAGTGRGTHHYTIHNFHAHPVVVARRHASGNRRRSELAGLSARIQELKAQLVARSRATRRLALRVALAVMVLGPLLALAGNAWLSHQSGKFSQHLSSGDLWMIGAVPWALVLLLSIAAATGAYLMINRDHDSWLAPP
ncbi:Cold-shock DNA-binding domain protein [compost metagenome]